MKTANQTNPIFDAVLRVAMEQRAAAKARIVRNNIAMVASLYQANEPTDDNRETWRRQSIQA